MRFRFAAATAVFVCVVALPGDVGADTPQPDIIFARAKSVWRARSEAAFVSYSLRERYVWRGRTHDNWWQGAYRDRDRNVALRRVIVETDEEQRLKGAPIHFDLHIHNGYARTDSLDTNPDADAFPILDPLIEPNASFGLVRSEADPRLVLSQTPAPAAQPSSVPTPVESQQPSLLGADKPLRELVRVEAVARDYAIALAGTEHVRGIDAFHLRLVPLRDPNVYRLRDVWVDPSSYATVQIAVQGLFEGKPYDAALWIVDYVNVGGRNYVQQIHTDETLRFGLDRIVSGLQFDFVSYDFPKSIPDMTFVHLRL